MNPVAIIIADIRFSIPEEILKAAFYQVSFGQRLTPMNIDALIREKVIENKVRRDCNLVGGTELLIDISDLTYEIWDTYRYCYRIPRDRTNGLAITRVVGVVLGNYMYNGSSFTGMGDYSQPLDASGSVLKSNSAIPYVASADVQLIGPNTVLVSDLLSTSTALHLRCFVENDADFNNLPNPTIQRFSELCVLAVKAYIYNKLKVPMDQGQLVGGMALGAFKEVIDSYADSLQLYNEFLLHKWKRIAILSDPMAKRRHSKFISGGVY